MAFPNPHECILLIQKLEVTSLEAGTDAVLDSASQPVPGRWVDVESFIQKDQHQRHIKTADKIPDLRQRLIDMGLGTYRIYTNTAKVYECEIKRRVVTEVVNDWEVT